MDKSCGRWVLMESEFLEALGLSMSFEEFEPIMKWTAYVDSYNYTKA